MRAQKIYKLEEKIFSYMEEHQMLSPGERVVAGISGGADSVCLLFVLLRLREKMGTEFAVVHVHHGIRPEAGEDARFVEELCREHAVLFYLKEVSVPELAAREKCSAEEAGRRARYRAFAEAAQEFGATKIAVAHNQNDCAETMLFHLFRGSGIRGLAGILPTRDEVIRPLLCLERWEIEAYLAELGQGFCQDTTNAGDDYTRNRIRHHILPYVEEQIAKNCVRHMTQTAELLEETEDFLRQQTGDALRECVLCNAECLWQQETSSKNVLCGEEHRRQTICREEVEDALEYRIQIPRFENFHPVIQKRILHELLKTLAPGSRDIAYVHVADLLELCWREGNRSIALPFGILARREYGEVILDRTKLSEKNVSFLFDPVEIRVDFGERQEVQTDGGKILFTLLSARDMSEKLQNCRNFPQNQYTKWFDYDKIEKSLMLRTRRTGDYLSISDGQGGMKHKILKDYMIAEKIPAGVRDEKLLLAEGSHVLWLVGYRISEYYKWNENTRHILQVEYIPESKTEDKDGGTYQSSFVGERSR